MKTAKEYAKEALRIFSNYGGDVPEADEEYNEANRNIIFALANEHDKNVVLFKYYPDTDGGERCRKYADCGRLYNFCADFVVPSDSEHFHEFEELVASIPNDGKYHGELFDKLYHVVEKCGGYELAWV